MTDIIVNLGMESPQDESALARTIQLYTVWRQNLCDAEERVVGDAPDIMVKTTGFCSGGHVEKSVIFQDRRWAAAFLRIWRSQRRLIN